MTSKLFLYSYNSGSGGARALARALGARRIKHGQSSFKPREDKAIINWGCSDLPEEYRVCRVFNDPDLIAIASNKLSFFHLGDGNKEFCRVPRWTMSNTIAQDWVNEGRPIVARTTLTGHSGKGLVYCNVDEAIPDAPLYVEYIKKKDEYRVHFIRGQSSPFVQRKVRNSEVTNPNWKVRNLAGGFRYANSPENVGAVPEDVIAQAEKAFRVTGLHFGAVDVIWNDSRKEAYVLEVNTAPGLMGKTIEFYAQGLGALIKEQ